MQRFENHVIISSVRVITRKLETACHGDLYGLIIPKISFILDGKLFYIDFNKFRRDIEI
jgi:hypothetical protein